MTGSPCGIHRPRGNDSIRMIKPGRLADRLECLQHHLLGFGCHVHHLIIVMSSVEQRVSDYLFSHLLKQSRQHHHLANAVRTN